MVCNRAIKFALLNTEKVVFSILTGNWRETIREMEIFNFLQKTID